MDYDLNAPSAGGEFIVSIIGSNAITVAVIDTIISYCNSFFVP